jgi:hypothetical protein
VISIISTDKTIDYENSRTLLNDGIGDKLTFEVWDGIVTGQVESVVTIDFGTVRGHPDGSSMTTIGDSEIGVDENRNLLVGKRVGEYEVHIGGGPGSGPERTGTPQVGYSQSKGITSHGADLKWTAGTGTKIFLWAGGGAALLTTKVAISVGAAVFQYAIH